MISELNPKVDRFQEMLDKFYLLSLSYNPSNKMKMKAWDHFKSLKLPSKKNESFRYVPLRKLFDHQYEIAKQIENVEVPSAAILPECKESLIVLVNGRYSEQLSNVKAVSTKVVIASLTKGANTYSSFLTNHFTKTLKEEKDPFVTLNAAISDEGVFIYLPPKTILDKPIQILHLIDSKDALCAFNPRIQVFVGAETEAEFVSTTQVISGSSYFLNHVSDFAIEENAHVRYTQVLNQTSNANWNFDGTRAILKKNSQFHVFAVTNGSQTVRADYKATLIGENAECSLNGLCMLEDNHEFHTHILMDHQAPFCRSRQLFKSVLDDSSKSSFEGKILVRQAAQKTDAFQLNSNLMLNDNTNAYSKPNLEIFADDVKASHGSTFGQLNEEQLFCLKSRGISDFEAKNLLIFGFCKEIIDLITLPSLQNMLINQAKRYKNKS